MKAEATYYREQLARNRSVVPVRVQSKVMGPPPGTRKPQASKARIGGKAEVHAANLARKQARFRTAPGAPKVVKPRTPGLVTIAGQKREAGDQVYSLKRGPQPGLPQRGGRKRAGESSGASLAFKGAGLGKRPKPVAAVKPEPHWSRDWAEDLRVIEEVSEAALETDADFPPSQVRLKDHPRGEAWCRQQVAYWTHGGFLPVAVSRLVGLCLKDCARLRGATDKRQLVPTRKKRLRVETEHGVVEATEGPVHYGADPGYGGDK